MKNQQTGWDFNRRMSRFNNDFMVHLKAHYDERLASANGMHFHVWIPKNQDENAMIDFYSTFIRIARSNRDAVSFSWDYLPEEK